MLPFCVLSEPFLLSAGHRDPGKSQGGRCTSPWVSPKEGGSRAQADPRPHCPPRRPGGAPGCWGGWGECDSLVMFLQAQGAPAPHLGKTVIEQCLKRLYSLKRMDFRFLKGQGVLSTSTRPFPGLGGQVLQKLVLREAPRDAETPRQQ